MNEYLAKTARSSMGEADVVLYLVDVSAKPDPLDTTYVTTLIPEGAVAILALNKTDRLKNKAVLLPMIRSWDALGIFSDIFPISAATGEGVGDLEKALREAVPEGEALYPADQWSEMPEKFFAAEIIRESLFNNLREELPYSSAVDVEVFDESARSDDGGLVRMIATIHVERNSQKGMVIGRGGQMLKKIGTEARERLAAFLGSKVYLELHVVVSKNWTKNESELKKLGYFARES
jgi:GTP-binding protein Era